MNRCRCGRVISIFAKYCAFCKENLSLKEKVIEGIRMDEVFGSQILKQPNNTQGDPMSTKSDNHTGCIRPETLRGSLNHGETK